MCTLEPREQVLTLAVQTQLIFFEAQHIVGARHLNLPGDLHLAPHRIDGHDGAGQIEHAEQLREGGDLVGCRVNFALRQYQLIG
jgi:hypothetical protein